MATRDDCGGGRKWGILEGRRGGGAGRPARCRVGRRLCWGGMGGRAPNRVRSAQRLEKRLAVCPVGHAERRPHFRFLGPRMLGAPEPGSSDLNPPTLQAPMTERPIAVDIYDALAESYAAAIDTKPHNAYYERPATLSLLPDVRRKRVLDAGCGPGVYAEWLLDHGAEVVAVDVSARMVELAKLRARGRAQVYQADLSRSLDFLDSQSFDIVLSPLVLEYIRDWRRTLGEFHRLLAPDGLLVVSVTHPFSDFMYFQSNRYFDIELVASEWKGFGSRVRMPSYRRSLEETLNPFIEAGFRLDRLIEPKPTEEMRNADPRHFEELSRQPCFLCIRAVKVQESIRTAASDERA